jgi:hypothetical protein
MVVEASGCRYARPVSGFLLAVDYGTVNTVALLRRPDGQVRPLLVDGSPLLPSAACLGPDGRLLVGRDAERAGRVDPASFVPDPRSRINAGTVTLGRKAFPVVEVIGATLSLLAREAVRGADGVRPRLVLTHPASWNEARRARLGEAGVRAGLGVPTLVPTPVAAAWYHAASAGEAGPDRRLLVFHLGAGTFEASLLRRAAQGYDLLATEGLDDVGGVDLDDLLIKTVGAAVPSGAADAWQRLVTPTSMAELRRFLQFCDDMRAAKEALSRQLTVGVQIPLVDQDLLLGREAFESAAEPLLVRTVEVAADLLTAAGTPADQVDRLLLLGGSTRIPLVTTLLHRRLGLAPTALKQPELAVAEGALIAVASTEGAPVRSSVPPGESTTSDVTAAEDPTPQVVPPAAIMPVTGSGPRRRPARLLAMAAGLACVVVAAGLYATRQPQHVVSGGGFAATGTPPAGTGPGMGGVASVPGTSSPIGPALSRSPSVTTTSSAPVPDLPTSAAVTTGSALVAISLTADPATGTCSTGVTFVAHFAVNNPGKYRWHWVFGGPNNYTSTSGEHDQDKTGDLRVTKKFDAGGSGSYWGQVQVTTPVAVASNRASVEITCTR